MASLRPHEGLALMRGINVGGKNIIKMADLKACVEDSGMEAVATYIQSGNVVFRTSQNIGEHLTRKLEQSLSRRFHYKARLVVLGHEDLRRTVRQAPREFGSSPATRRYDVIFLRKPLTAGAALKHLSLKEGVDTAVGGTDVLYCSRLIAKAGQSRLPRITKLPMYQHMTIRNWNTTTNLLALMDARAKTSGLSR